MNINSLVEKLKVRLTEPLPGLQAQLTMSSTTRIRELMRYTIPDHAVPSSVLVLLYPVENEAYTVFIRRPKYDGIHSGQISLPGGKAEENDADPAMTALREAREEIGIIPEHVTILGKLTDLYIPPSNFLVSPYIGYTQARPEFSIDLQEVEEVIEVRVDDLLSGDHLQVVDIRVRDEIQVTAPAWVIDRQIIWGATAMMLAEFCEIVRKK